MKAALKVIFQPLSNRHYAGRRRSAIMYAARYLPVLTICVLCALFVHPVFWLVVAGVGTVGLMTYMLFDRLVDKLTWRGFWGRFYDGNQAGTDAEQLMKAVETNPTAENRRKLADHLKQTVHRS